MKRSLYLFISLLALTISSFAQTAETFDIATFTAPSGWKKQLKEGAVTFTTFNESKGTFAMLALYRSSASSGSPKRDFEGDWQEFISGQLGITSKPEIDPATKEDGWDITIGGGGFKNEMGTSAVSMKTFSGYGKKLSVAAIFNREDDLPAIEAFVSSIKLAKSVTVARPAPVNDNGGASILGTWGVSHSDQSAYSVNNAVSGYISREYTFNADGTYRFISKTFEPFSAKLIFGKESGTYRISGDLLTITPKSSVLEWPIAKRVT